MSYTNEIIRDITDVANPNSKRKLAIADSQKSAVALTTLAVTASELGLDSHIVEGVGEDVSREGLLDTPTRAAKAILSITSGYEQSLDDIVNGAVFESGSDEMVLVKSIEMYSVCEHHVLPFIGTCHIGYIPNGKVLGLSKFARIVDMYSRRLQIQERLTREIADAILSVTGAAGVGVIVEAKHMCMMMRGVEKQHSTMGTSVMLGEFRESYNTRQEFLRLLGDMG